MISITKKRDYQNNPNLQPIFSLWVSEPKPLPLGSRIVL